VYRCELTLDGETVTSAENHIGYLHRGVEKIAESKTYPQFLPYTDRLDYLCPMVYNHGYVETIEKLMGVEVPQRAEYIRVIMSELSRVTSHLVMVATMAIDLSSSTAWMYCLREREKVLDLIEMTCGSRLTVSYMRIGGISEDLPVDFIPGLRKFISEFPANIKEIHDLLSGNEIYLARTRGIGVLPPDMAVAYGVTGPNLRASGVAYDVRRSQPYSVYDQFDFEIPVRHNGDSLDRYLIRFDEMEQSLRIIEQALDHLPDGEIKGKVPKMIKVPAGEIYHQVESSKGALGFFLVSDGSSKPYRLHIRGPSYVNIGVFPELARGWKIQDVITILASIDPVLGEIDR
jgi:NADH-quinone oxidoreductase subunit D